MIYRKTCEWCGTSFSAQKSSTRFCSKLCTDHAYKAKMRQWTQDLVQEHHDQENKTNNSQQLGDIFSLKLLALYLGVSRTTAFRYVAEGVIPSVKVRGRIKVRRSDVEKIFDSAPPYQKRSSNSPASIKGGENTSNGGKNKSGESYTTVKAVAERYGLSLAGTDKILKSAGITVINHKGKHFYYLSEVEALFRKREAASHPEITEWYTSSEVQEKFKLKPATVYDIVSTYQIPSKKVRNVTYYSKIHFDMARGVKPEGSDLWYTVQEAMEKYGQTRDQVYNVLRYNNIQRVQVGRNVKFRRDDYDALMRFAVKPNSEK